VCQNEGFIVVVPYWAVWPFEVIVIALHHVGNLSQFTETQQQLFADIIKKITVRYDNLFQCSFPYSMGKLFIR
jgi:UDPglucose--hexose-1-phosphate uridylyltransferase